MDFNNFLLQKEFCYEDDQNYKNSTEIREIKQLLLSGSKEKIIIAAGRVLTLINDNSRAIQMINCDIPEFLCDAMLPFDSHISGTIYNCFDAMTQFEIFFVHGHSSGAIETITRSIHLLFKNGVYDIPVRQPLKSLLLILEGYSKYNVLPERKPFECIVNLGLVLLKKNTVSQENILVSGAIIKELFEISLTRPIILENLLELSEMWFDIVCSKRIRTSSLSNEVEYLGSALSELTLRYLSKNDSKGEISFNFQSNSVADNLNSILNKIKVFLVDFLAPNIVISPVINDRKEVQKIKNFFLAVLYIFRDMYPLKQEMARRLAEIGLLQFVKNIVSSGVLKQCDESEDVSLKVLFEVLLSLSDDIFHFPEMWPNGRDHFRMEIIRGVSLIPANVEQWMDILTDPETNRSVRLALVIYFYFNFLTMKSDVTDIICPSAIKFLNVLVGMNYSAVVIKSIWFIFVMSQMSRNTLSPRSSSYETKKMLEILENQTNLSFVYTHHPALLYWTFASSKVSCRIQIEVVKLWLENKSPDCTILDDLVKKSADARLAIFQLLQDGHEHLPQLAFSTLKIFMSHSEDDTLSYNLWFVLPQILAKFTTDTSKAVSVDCIIELAALKVPPQPDVSKMIRIASLLPEALDKSDLISWASVLKLILQLFQVSDQYDDTRILCALLRRRSFMNKIVSGIQNDISEIVLNSLKITIFLWRKKFNAQLKPDQYEKIKFDPNTVLRVLNGTDLELIKCALVLMTEIMETEFRSDLLVLEGVTPDFLKILLFDVENVLIRYIPVISGSAWTCTKLCLQYGHEESLIDDALLNEVITYGMEYLKETPDMTDFLIVWLEKKIEKEKYFTGGRHIQESYFFETVKTIASYLAGNSFEDSRRLSRKILEFCDHFSVDISQEPFNKIRS